MTELKTLKDCCAENMCCQEFLRQEAIKWIKLMEQIMNSKSQFGFIHQGDYKLTYHPMGDNDSMVEVRNWIKHFFNITDEQLKQEIEK